MLTKYDDPYLEQLRQLIIQFLADYPIKIYLFGSRAKGVTRLASDVDIAILPYGQIPIDLMSRLRDLIEESHVPYLVDVTDLSQATDNDKEKIIKKAVLWKD